MSQLSELVKKIAPFAPTVASLFGGPGAGLAVEAIGKAFGIDSPTTDSVTAKLSTMQMNGDQVLQLKQAELALQSKMKELDISEEKLRYDDLDSARKREMSVRDLTTPALAWTVVGASVALGAAAVLGWITKDPTQATLVGTVIGYVFSEGKQVLSYYFGSSSSSEEKTSMIYNSTPNKQVQ
jgi:divalent metal cation (Fe/Co/Zn/Cd) transporter